MKLPPAYQFPTTTVFIDDEISFIDEIHNGLNPDHIIVRKFDAPIKALEFLQNNTASKKWHDKCTRISLSENDFDSVAIEVKFSKISSILEDQNRFNQITSIVVDYQMPQINGLTLLEMLKDFPAKKILLTGIADAEMAISALEQGLIDAYIKKHDPNALFKIQETIQNYQRDYFQEQSCLMNTALKIYQEKDFLLSDSYCNLFRTVKDKYNAIEHYLMDENGSCMFVGKNAQQVKLIVKSLEQIESEQDCKNNTSNKHLPLRLGNNYYYTIET